MSKFHAMIMNIRHTCANLQTDEYKMGHRDARHAAAEIASRADAEIGRLEEVQAALVEDLEKIANDIMGIAVAAITKVRP